MTLIKFQCPFKFCSFYGRREKALLKASLCATLGVSGGMAYAHHRLALFSLKTLAIISDSTLVYAGRKEKMWHLTHITTRHNNR